MTYQCQTCFHTVRTEHNAKHTCCCARPNYKPTHTGRRHISGAEWREFKNDGIPLGADLPKGYED